MIRRFGPKSKLVRLGAILGVLLSVGCADYDERDPLKLGYEQIAEARPLAQ